MWEKDPLKSISKSAGETVHTPKYLLPSQWIPVLAPTYSLPVQSEYLLIPPQSPRGFSALARLYYLATKTAMLRRLILHQSVAPNLSDMWRSTSEMGAARLRSVTEIAPKPFVYVNRSPIRYGFHIGERAIGCGFPELPANRKRQEVTWQGPCRQVCGLRFTFVRLDHTPEVSDLPQSFLHPKISQSHVWEEILLFTTLLLTDYQILFPKNVILNTVSQLK